MNIKPFLILGFASVLSVAYGQTKAPTTKPAPSPTPATRPRATATPTPKPAATKPAATVPTDSEGVLAAFNKLLDGIRHANVNEVTAVYQNSPRLSLFNYNGTVTKGWEQMRKNRESSYPEIKDTKLETRDL